MLPRRTLGAVVVAVLPLVAACGAGRNTTTDKEHQTPYVSNASAGSLLVTAASLVPSESASGPNSPTPTPVSSGGSGDSTSTPQAYLVASIVNRGTTPDELTGVLVQGATVTPTDTSSSGLTLPPSQAVTFGDPELGSSSGNALQINGLTQVLSTGSSVPVTFQFRQAGSVTLQVLVRSSDSYGTTATSTPLPLTGSYPAATETPEGLPTGG